MRRVIRRAGDLGIDVHVIARRRLPAGFDQTLNHPKKADFTPYQESKSSACPTPVGVEANSDMTVSSHTQRGIRAASWQVTRLRCAAPKGTQTGPLLHTLWRFSQTAKTVTASAERSCGRRAAPPTWSAMATATTRRWRRERRKKPGVGLSNKKQPRTWPLALDEQMDRGTGQAHVVGTPHHTPRG